MTHQLDFDPVMGTIDLDPAILWILYRWRGVDERLAVANRERRELDRDIVDEQAVIDGLQAQIRLAERKRDCS